MDRSGEFNWWRDKLQIRTDKNKEEFLETKKLYEKSKLHCEELKAINNNLQTALNSRIIIEQAKGILSERQGISIDEAFNVIRKYSRNHNVPLREVAQAVVDGTLFVVQ